MWDGGWWDTGGAATAVYVVDREFNNYWSLLWKMPTCVWMGVERRMLNVERGRRRWFMEIPRIVVQMLVLLQRRRRRWMIPTGPRIMLSMSFFVILKLVGSNACSSFVEASVNLLNVYLNYLKRTKTTFM